MLYSLKISEIWKYAWYSNQSVTHILHGIIKKDAQIHKQKQPSLVKHSQLHFMNGKPKAGLTHYYCQLQNKTDI